MSRYLTLAEIAMLYERPLSTLRRLATTDRWERSGDRRKPVLYLARDVRHTMARVDKRAASERS